MSVRRKAWYSGVKLGMMIGGVMTTVVFWRFRVFAELEAENERLHADCERSVAQELAGTTLYRIPSSKES